MADVLFKREKASARASSDRFCLSPLKPNILYPKPTYQVQNSSNNSKILIQILKKRYNNSVII